MKNKNIHESQKPNHSHTHHAPPIIQLTILAISHTPILPASLNPAPTRPHTHTHKFFAANPNLGPPAASSNTTNCALRKTSPKIDWPIPLLLCKPPKQFPASDAGA